MTTPIEGHAIKRDHRRAPGEWSATLAAGIDIEHRTSGLIEFDPTPSHGNFGAVAHGHGPGNSQRPT